MTPRPTDRVSSGGVPTLPVNLLLSGRPCLVVGAGKIAARKAAQLCEAGGTVTVVGATAGDAVRDLCRETGSRLVERAFRADDVAGMFLVSAATDDAGANLRVLEACRRRGILCACVDFHWRDGDMISPAVLRSDDITVAVSTGGRSCRRSRLVRDSLSRHLAGVNTADLLVIGCDHRQLPLPWLEGQSLAGRNEATGRLLKGIWGLHEFLLLGTSRRVELWALAADDPDVHELLRRAVGLGSLAPDAYYVRRGGEAFEHVALLAAGLLSHNLGECQTVEAMNEALAASEQRGSSGSILRAWLSGALQVAAAIRAATSDVTRLGQFAQSDGDDAGTRARSLSLARQIAGQHHDLYEKLIRNVQGRHAGE